MVEAMLSLEGLQKAPSAHWPAPAYILSCDLLFEYIYQYVGFAWGWGFLKDFLGKQETSKII